MFVISALSFNLDFNKHAKLFNMRKLLLLSFTLVCAYGFLLTPALAGSASQQSEAPVFVSKQANKKEARKQKRAERIKKLMANRLEKINKKAKKRGFSDLDKNLQLCLVFVVASIAFGIASYFAPFLWILSSLAGLAAAIFFVLWLIEYLE